MDDEDDPERRWASLHKWAVTTVEESEGEPPRDPPSGYVLFDASSDDPPIAVFPLFSDAAMVAVILDRFGDRR